MKPTIDLRRALADPLLLGKSLAGPSWSKWRTLLIAALGESLDDSERTLFQLLTGRSREPGARVEELCVIAGRRGGKSRAISVLGLSGRIVQISQSRSRRARNPPYRRSRYQTSVHRP
jgi:hypothetical protein